MLGFGGIFEMANDEEIVVVTINNPADVLERILGVRPRSGVCMFCRNALTTEDTDHSVCNSCWDKTFAHRWEDYDGSCNLCDEDWDNAIHKRDADHVHNFEKVDETKVVLDNYCPLCGYREPI